MKLPKTYKAYTIKELAIMLGMSEKVVKNKITKLKLKRIKSEKADDEPLYSPNQLELLRGNKELRSLTDSFPSEKALYERKQIPVVIIYHFYESKMNNM